VLSSYAVISYTENWMYVAFAAIGSALPRRWVFAGRWWFRGRDRSRPCAAAPPLTEGLLPSLPVARGGGLAMHHPHGSPPGLLQFQVDLPDWVPLQPERPEKQGPRERPLAGGAGWVQRFVNLTDPVVVVPPGVVTEMGPVVAAAGTVIGILLADWGAGVLLGYFATPDSPLAVSAQADGLFVLFSAVVGSVAALVCSECEEIRLAVMFGDALCSPRNFHHALPVLPPGAPQKDGNQQVAVPPALARSPIQQAPRPYRPPGRAGGPPG